MNAFDPNAHDLAALQGTWQQVAFEEDGDPAALDGTATPDALTVIDGHQFAVRTPQGELLLRGHFTLDATVTPKAITWIDAVGPDAGKPLPASYRLDGDRFTFIAADTGAPRPTHFRTVRGLTMRSFVRCAPAP